MIVKVACHPGLPAEHSTRIVTHFHLSHTSERPPLPAPDELPYTPPDFFPRRILLIVRSNASSKRFPRRRRDANCNRIPQP